MPAIVLPDLSTATIAPTNEIATVAQPTVKPADSNVAPAFKPGATETQPEHIWMFQLGSNHDTYMMLGFGLFLFLAPKAADWIVDKVTALIAKITFLIIV